MNKQHKMGMKACNDGLKSDDCPYESSHDLMNASQKRVDWMKGYYFQYIKNRHEERLLKHGIEWKWED